MLMMNIINMYSKTILRSLVPDLESLSDESICYFMRGEACEFVIADLPRACLINGIDCKF